MLLERDLLQFEVGYRIGYTNAKEEEEGDLSSFGEVAPIDALTTEGDDPETNYIREVWRQ